MEISEITAFIITLAPTISAVIGMIVTIVVGIKKIRSASDDTLNRVKQANLDTLEECRKQNAEVIQNVAQIAQKNDELTRENAELKRDMRKIMAKLNHVHIKDDK